tara:strand:- start:1444327 stop:1444428 length:102 start_codon:yes stop_codon:yes gene_type:complete
MEILLAKPLNSQITVEGLVALPQSMQKLAFEVN